MKPLPYQRRPLTFEAIRWDSDPETMKAVEAWTRASRQNVRMDGRTGILYLTTAEGGVGCAPGDFLVRGIDDEVYPVLARRFEQLYEAVPAKPPVINADLVRKVSSWRGPYGNACSDPAFVCNNCAKFCDDDPLPSQCPTCGAEMTK